jgi:hypothetical protein
MIRISEGQPSLSVVLVTDQYSTVRLVVKCFAAQTVSDRIEMVIAIPGHKASQVPIGELTMFHSVRVQSLESIRPMPAARAAAVRATTAPVIFIGETHSFPHPAFAEELIAAHEAPWDVVVPGLENANPGSPQSWAAFILDYGYWLTGLSPSEIPNGPTWNASYKREVLLDMGSALDVALSSGDELPQALRARGSRVYFEPKAVIDHTNVESNGWIDERFLSGLVVGANRTRRWSRARRVAYFLASPLIPLVLLNRLRGPLKLLLKKGALPGGSLPALLFAVTVRTIGEAIGYVVGIDKSSEERMEDYELHKLRHASQLAGAVEALA